MSATLPTAPAPADRRIPRRLVIAAVAVLPAVVFVGANVLQYGVGFDGAATWLDPFFTVPIVNVALTLVILTGPVVAFLLSASWLLPLRFVPDGDAWQVKIRARLDPWAVGIAVVSLGVGGILFGHLLAENLACMIGVASSC
jgi:hypothetical protein